MSEFERNFDKNAEDYEASRPIYLNELYDDIFKYKNINSNCNVLEIGIGTGKATLPILDTKCNLTAIEPGEELARLTKEKFKNYNNFSLYNETLQDFEGQNESFDLIYAATAFHWIPEEYGYKRVYDMLKHNGAFARFAYHAGPDKKRKTLVKEIQEVYTKYMNKTEPPKEFSEDDSSKLTKIAEKYGFVQTQYKIYGFTKDFTSDEYIKLLKTYPDHMALDEKIRVNLFNDIYTAINKNGGVITVYYCIDLELARKS